jgi:hypothetical protein
MTIHSFAAPPSLPTSGPARRGVLFVRWGDTAAIAARAVASVRAVHPELPIHVHELPPTATLLDKAGMFDLSPFEETLYLDVDTVVLDRLDFGFDMAARYGLACCICECPWARRYGGIQGDLVEYNTGVLFFARKAKAIFDAWAARVRAVDSSIKFINQQRQEAVMPYNDQAAFALAVADAPAPPFILPMNWNLRPQWQKAWWGPVKVWHDYAPPPPPLAAWTRQQADPGAVIQYVSLGG